MAKKATRIDNKKMAVNRKMSNLVPAATQLVAGLGNRAPTMFDQEKEDFEKAQTNAMLKCLSLEECAAKEKHVRTLMIGTYHSHGAKVFWRKLKDSVPVHGNDVVCWKFLIVLHRIMQDGHKDVIKGTLEHSRFIEQVCRTHGQTRTSYGKLVEAYGDLILSRLAFHHKYKEVSGNFNLKDSSLQTYDAGYSFELAIDFLDATEQTIKMMKLVMGTFDIGSRSHSLTASGQCRLAALIPCTYDTTRLLDLLSKFLRLLHQALPWDTLSGHRQRFRVLYGQLRDIYDKLNNIQYLRAVLQIPKLSDDLSHFMNTLHRIAEYPEHEEEVEQPPHQDLEATNNDLISVGEDSVDTSMAYIQQEYSDLSSRYQSVLQMLHEEQQARTAMAVENQAREAQWKQEAEALRKSYAEFATNNREDLDKDNKMEKLKSAYQKLRQDHIVLLRQKAESEKKSADLQKAVDKAHVETATDLKALQDFLAKHGMTGDIQQGLRELEDKLNGLQVSLVAKEKAAKSLEEEKQMLSSQTEKHSKLQAEFDTLQSNFEQLNEKHTRSLQELGTLQSVAEKAKQDQVQLEALTGRWQAHIKDCIGKLDSYFDKEISLSGGLPSKQVIFGPTDPMMMTRDWNTDRIPVTADLLFQVMSTLVHLQPYANGDTVKLNDLFVKGHELLGQLESGDQSMVNVNWQNFLASAQTQMSALEATKWDPSDDVDKEIHEMHDAINAAAAAMEKLMLEARSNEATKPNVDVDIKILDSCAALLAAVQVLIVAARHLQNEITRDSGGFAKEFYRKNQKWSEGLISAAKDIGGGAKFLVDAADAVVSGNGKFEELMAASQEIAGSTAQMVLASRVKARKDSKHLTELSSSSKTVGEATAHVIATCRACASQLAESEQQVDLNSLSVHQSKRLEMEVQIKVLELETQLDKQRQKLFAIRKLQYANSNKGATQNNDEH